MAVVKANAYGHGMIECAKALNKCDDKPEYFGVALVEEALELRKSGIKQPVLVFSPVFLSDAEYYKKYNIIPTVFNQQHLEILTQHKGQKKVRVHVKIDTGMGRLGIKYDKAVDFIENLSSQSEFVIDGIYTHFATSDEWNKSFANTQLQRFKEIISLLKQKGINYGLAHAANSGAILDLPDSYLDMVRPGISLYGYYPSKETTASIKLKPVMSLISNISSIKEINKGESVSYGRKFISNSNTKIATVPIGYADGFVRGLTNKTTGIIKGKKYRQVGQVCMDRIMFNIGNNNIKTGDKIILLGSNKKEKITAWDWSDILHTIPYEITCNISKRVPRIYIG